MSLKLRYISASLHGLTVQKTSNVVIRHHEERKTLVFVSGEVNTSVIISTASV